MTLWLAGLAIGALFGWCWGYSAGSKAAVIVTLPDTPEKESEGA
jgi:hypothetical protein